MKFLKKALKNIFLFFLFLGIALVVYIFSDTIYKYVIHGKSFYQVFLGDQEYKKGNYTEAIEYYNKAIKLYPNHYKARYNLAHIYVNFEDFESAVNEYEQVLKYKPDHLGAKISLGIVLSEQLLEFDKAIKQYQEVVDTKIRFINIPFFYDNKKYIVDSKAIAYYNMGLAYRDKSMLFTEKPVEYRKILGKAAESYKLALTLNPDNYDAQYNWALTKHLLGSYTEALAGYCKALLISPLDYEAHYNLAILLKQKNRYKDAFYEFKQAGSLMDYIGDSSRAAYIYGMLSQVSQMAIAEYGYEPRNLIERLGEGYEKNGPDLENEFLTIEEIEKAMIKRIKTKSICKDYLNRF